jgi:hypothetical protein
MKYLILIILPAFFVNPDLACKDFKNGAFLLPQEDKSNHKIIRTSTKQIEIVETKKLQSEFDIKWLDECTYILFNRRVTKGTDEMPQFNKDTLYNHIGSITGNTCTITSWFRWSDKLKAIVIKVK